MTGEYLRWGESVWGAIWGVPPGRPVVHGGGNQTVSAIKRSSSGQTPVKVSANGTLSVQGVAAEHVRSSVSLSGGGAIGLVASKRATVRCVVAGGGIATVVGSAHEAVSASVSISGVGSQATTARKHAYWGLPKPSAGGEIAVDGAKGIPSLISVSGSGALSLVVRKNGVSRASVSTGGFLSAAGRKGTKVSFAVS